MRGRRLLAASLALAPVALAAPARAGEPAAAAADVEVSRVTLSSWSGRMAVPPTVFKPPAPPAAPLNTAQKD